MVCAGSSSARAWSAPATVALGAKSPPMASNAMRANARLPWLLLAAHRRSTRTPRRRDAGASCSGSAGTSGSRSRARSCACCARASSSSRYVSSGRPLFVIRMNVEYALREARRGLRAALPSGCQSLTGAQSQRPTFQSVPHVGQSPLQSSRHSTNAGAASSHASRTAGRRSSCARLRVERKDIRVVRLPRRPPTRR